MRALAICAVLAGCGRPEALAPARAPTVAAVPVTVPAAAGAPAPAPIAGTADAAAPARGWRLADGVAPIAYDLTLELDPDSDAFTGRVAITIAVAAPGTTRLWLHAVDLAIASARLQTPGRDEEVTVLAADAGSQLQGFALPRAVGRDGGEPITLVIEYRGHATDLSGRTGKDEEGLFREHEGGHWYLYAQSESIFARKILPCFDEPRFKPAWRVTAIVPRDLVVLANAPSVAERALPDGRREVRFAEIARLPSYLFAVAVGPFDLVAVGRLGRARMPVRLAVARGDRRRTGLAIRTVPRIIDALESYFDAAMPSVKLDLVAVPRFFGAMENTGLVTFDDGVLVGGRELVSVAAHELAHQWFGNAVTPAWWDELWLSEAFATWLGERVTESLGVTRPPVMAHGTRARALWADEQIDAEALVHPIASSDDIEPRFDAIAYDKGAAVLATFERFVGAAAFQAAVRAYMASHAGTSVTSRAFLDALAAATSPAVAAALASNLAHAGTPVVGLGLRCGAAPTIGEARSRGVGPPVGSIVASARDGVTIPVCARFPLAAGRTTRVCFLAGSHTEQPLPEGAGCPAWLVGNDGGRGYYQTAWLGAPAIAPVAQLSPEERLTRGDDAAAAFRRGELRIADALAELSALATTRDPYGQLAALSIARAIDPLVADPVRPAWTGWLAARFADRLTRAALTAPRSRIDHALRAQLVALARAAIDPAILATVRAAVERAPDGDHDTTQLRLAAARDAEPLFGRIVQAAADATTDAARDAMVEALGEFPAAFAPRLADLLLDQRLPAAEVWGALAAMLERGETHSAAWRALRPRLASLLAALPTRGREVIEATGSLCDPGERAEVAAELTPRLHAIVDGKRALAHALAAIDRCLARRAAAGDIAQGLAASGQGGLVRRRGDFTD